MVTASPSTSTVSHDGDVVTIPAGLRSSALLTALQPFLTPSSGLPPKRVHFSNPHLAFGGWAEAPLAAQFETTVGGLPVRWCCRPDAVAKQHGVELHHQLTMHPVAGTAADVTGSGSAVVATALATAI